MCVFLGMGWVTAGVMANLAFDPPQPTLWVLRDGGMVPSCLQDQLHLSLSLRAEIRCKEWNYKGPEPEIEQESHEHTHGKTCCSSDPSEAGCMRSDLRKWDQSVAHTALAHSALCCHILVHPNSTDWGVDYFTGCLLPVQNIEDKNELEPGSQRAQRI